MGLIEIAHPPLFSMICIMWENKLTRGDNTNHRKKGGWAIKKYLFTLLPESVTSIWITGRKMLV